MSENIADLGAVNAVVKTLDCFYDTYPEIQEGDGMYLPPEDRVKIW